MLQGALIYEAESGKLLELDRKENKCVHAFLSHTQSSGQDLTTTINMSLKLVMPEIELFQDVSYASE